MQGPLYYGIIVCSVNIIVFHNFMESGTVVGRWCVLLNIPVCNY